VTVTIEAARQADGTVRRPRWAPLALVVLFTATALVGASLLFAVEPMVAKMLLPAYGGSPMVWNTAVLFFQGALLAGYAYAHWSQRRLGAFLQPLVHVVLLLLPLAVLPIALPGWAVAPESTPTALWLLLVLAVMVGAPFAVLATTGPLVQRWYSWSGLPRADDPYFLYAAGNVGSFLALLAYPFLIEPAADVAAQARWWAACYIAFAAMMIICAVLVRLRAAGETVADRSEPDADDDPAPENATASTPETATAATPETATAATPETVTATAPETAATGERIGWRRRARWLGLAFIPSSLFLGVTTHISTDIAAIPLMWVVPLALYLATFIIAFSATRLRWLPAVVRPSALVAPVLPWILLIFGADWGVRLLPLDLLLVVIGGLACHGMLARDRPGPQRLTEFFLYVSLGGALGGVANGLLAPVVFDWVAELPLAVAALALLAVATVPPSRAAPWFTFPGWWALTRAFAITTPTVAVIFGLRTGLPWLILLGAVALVAWGCYVARRPRALLAAAVFTVAILFLLEAKAAPIQERTFFGSYQVDVAGDRRVFSHGTTVHGFQLLDAARRRTPTSYYARTGPLGDVFTAFGNRPASSRVAAVGLGTGTVAAYGRTGQQLDFYEIDPAVIRIARAHFTYLRDCACEERAIVGDGRLELESAPDGTYGIIILDAFSSDAVPAHLLTREAIQLYARKLAPGGVLAFNVSNRNLNLAPMLGATARAAGFPAIAALDAASGSEVALPSVWVVIARSDAELRSLRAQNPRWRPVRTDGPVWTDGYSSLFGVLLLR
jgi:SAM-dependent methyltransferase